tara:strand:- start:5312 stop:7513 length:2202 start_codon:yes stop_codon:yes gene_type:complete
MISSFEISVEVSERYDFNKNSLKEINQNIWVKNQWPLVYFIQNEAKKVAYIGESTNFSNRIKNHLANSKKANAFNQISIIGSDKFNKSATLDIESKLIQYISSEGTYELQNGNHGLINHNYYQQDLYKNLFKDIWGKLIENKIVSKSLEEIENTELFKYSPYKSLNEDQYNSVLEIIEALTEKKTSKIFIKGSAGTGKTILATYLIKLLGSDVSDTNMDDFSDNEIQEINLIRAYKIKYPKAEIGFVVAMSSLRKTLQNVFRKIPELKSSMIISPSDTFKKKYDLLIIDEAHRLRQYKNIGWMGVFKKNNQKLGLDNTGTELDWIIANSTNQIFFYDPAQSVKPSDIPSSHFDKLLNEPNTIEIELKSQMRSNGGNDYITFVDDLLNIKRENKSFYTPEKYDIVVFDSMKDMYEQLSIKEERHGLSRLVAGYSWPWASQKDKNAIDIEIDGVELQWNKTDKDWINSEDSFRQVGCIHTTQGYDLNYTGVIFGEEISFNNATREIEIDKSKYFDKNGKRGLDNIEELKTYIINIYKTIMFRGIKGVYIYACDKNLREYFKEHISPYKSESKLRILPFTDVKPHVNAVPIFDIYAAAGGFSGLQIQTEYEDYEWIELPINISARKDYFVCQVIGESMNKKIENGAWCLFRKDPGGSREGKIVLVEHYNIQDSDFGSGLTIKSYHSEKNISGESWSHKSIILKPLSFDPQFENIILDENEISELKVIGEFITVLDI